jgi:hypothetical protein
MSQGFSRCNSYLNVYMLQQVESLLLSVLYVDELFITWSSTSSIFVVKSTLHDKFSMSDLGLLHYFIGLEITQSDSRIKMIQSKYALYV